MRIALRYIPSNCGEKSSSGRRRAVSSGVIASRGPVGAMRGGWACAAIVNAATSANSATIRLRIRTRPRDLRIAFERH